MLVDSHCHLDRVDLSPYDGDMDAMLDAARARGVGRFLCIGIDRDNAPTVKAIADRYPDVYASVGIHPLDLAESVEAEDAIVALADHPKVVAIGETGLDYHYSSERKSAQQESFHNHLRAAARLDKPVVVHTREAREDTLRLLREAASPSAAGVLHCFTESWEMARAALDLGFYISFSGIITFRNADSLRDVVRQVPMDRLLVETDSPYLAPVPHRGKKNEPRFVVEVAACVAEIKGLSIQSVKDQTTSNFNTLFRL
ncbi:MAG: TatD family hydrolase [Spongiibacteraceae bacterium]|nr:TatD family hydrolase [Spongiibacteraceae bacterium]